MAIRKNQNAPAEPPATTTTTTTEDEDEADPDTDDFEEDTDDSTQEETRVQRANAEAKRRRFQLKEERQGRREAETVAMDASLRLALAEAGVPRNRIPTAIRAIDSSGCKIVKGAVVGVDEAIEDLRDEWPEMFTDSDDADTDDLPSTGSRHNSARKSAGKASIEALQRKYPALR